MMNLITMPLPVGGHFGGWRHPQAWKQTTMNLQQVIEIARIAERGLLDSVFLADGNAVRYMDRPAMFSAANNPGSRPVSFEPLTLLAALSQHTDRIGLVATATTTYEEPYLVARRYASLDHISQGRAGWNVVTSTYPGDALNFSKDANMRRGDRYQRAGEFVEVVRKLWNSWADDAFVEDQAAGRYVDPSRVRRIDHRGAHFTVQGPLNVARPPQGNPVIFMAGQSDAGRELAASTADAVFGAGDTIEACQAAYADIKGRMAKYGRDPDSLRFLPGISIFVAETRAQAQELYEELQALIPPELGVDYLSQRIAFDLTGHPIDGPFPELEREIEGGNSFRTYIIDTALRDKLTIRQTYQKVMPALGSAVFLGTPAEVADQMEAWYRGKACDGFMISSPVQPIGLERVVDLLIPELQRRNLFRTAYRGKTLRENMGLDTPANPFF